MEPQPGRYEVLGRLAGIPFVGFGYQLAGALAVESLTQLEAVLTAG